MHSAFAGEVRFVVENNGVERIDTGFNKNLILNQGLHFFGGVAGTDIMAYCLVGSGNSQPATTQTQLDACVVGVSGGIDSSKYDYVDDGSNTYKCSLTKSYVFTTLAGQNISEVGLASQYSNPSSNYLCTRALIKDINGNPTVLSLIEGDTLTIYYKLWVVHSTLDTNKVINMSNGFGGVENFNTKARLHSVGVNKEWATKLTGELRVNEVYVHTGEINSITGRPRGNIGEPSAISLGEYNNDFARVATLVFDTSRANGDIRVVYINSSYYNQMGFYQVRFGRASDDAPIAKDNTKELTIPVKFTWGRYEGAL